jgi:predicted  nucleic acid-binding Zn-ribbon protein
MNSDDNDRTPTLEDLTGEFATLKSTRDTLAGEIKQLAESLQTLKAESKQEFGTDNVEELETLLAEKQSQNTLLCEKYAKHLVELQEQLEQLQAATEQDDDGTDEIDVIEEELE